MSSFAEKIRDLAARVERNNAWRQRECFNLIPSESTPSLLVKMCEISDPSGRYAEHRTMKGDEVYFYQGTDFIRDVEVEARAELAKFFGCGEVELRPISGQMANEVVFKGMVKFINRGKAEGTPSRRLRLVMNNDLDQGRPPQLPADGRPLQLRRGGPGHRQGAGRPPSRSSPTTPTSPTSRSSPRSSATHKPELIVFGKSMFIYQEPVRFVADIVKDWTEKPVLMFDMAHVLGLYGAFQEPLAEGAERRHREHPQDLLRPPARAHRGQLPAGDAAPQPVARHQGPGLPRLDVEPPPRDAPRPAHGRLRDERVQGAPTRSRSGPTPRPSPRPSRTRASRSRATRATGSPRPTRSSSGSSRSGTAWPSPAASRRTTS